MAPPNVRGSSSNRKAQLGVFTGYLIAAAGAAIGAALLIISLWQPQALAGLRSMMSDAAAPVGTERTGPVQRGRARLAVVVDGDDVVEGAFQRLALEAGAADGEPLRLVVRQPGAGIGQQPSGVGKGEHTDG